MRSRLLSKFPATVIFALLLLLLAACQPIVAPEQPTEVDVRFRNIVAEEWGANFNDIFTQEPHLFVITSGAELSLLRPYILPEHLELAHQTNFTTDAVVVVLRGVQPGNKHQVVIERITKRGNTLVVHAQFLEPPPGVAVATAETLPYHLVKIRKSFVDEDTKLELQQK